MSGSTIQNLFHIAIIKKYNIRGQAELKNKAVAIKPLEKLLTISTNYHIHKIFLNHLY